MYTTIHPTPEARKAMDLLERALASARDNLADISPVEDSSLWLECHADIHAMERAVECLQEYL